MATPRIRDVDHLQNPTGLCLCGCGGRTGISPVTSTRFGYIKGQPRRYLRGHQRRVGNAKCACGQPVTKRDDHLLRCKDCLKRDRRYGLEPGEYAQRFIEQGGCCAICRLPQTNPRWKNLNVDHDHETGAVRGLLCNRCNMGLGYIEQHLRAAADYLERAR